MLVTESGHHVIDEMAVEQETAELLYALVRASKPLLVVESGTGKGYATQPLLEALRANGQGGRLVTFEPEEEFRTVQQQIYKDAVDCEVKDGTSEGYGFVPGLVFIDCWGRYREPVIRYWLTHPERPLVVIHDANRPYPFHLGEGVHIPGHDGVWIGRAKEKSA